MTTVKVKTNTITVYGAYSNNGRTTTIRLDIGGAINGRQVQAAYKRLGLIAGQHIKLVDPELGPVTIYDRNGNYVGELS